jgi:hypothetical protein
VNRLVVSRLPRCAVQAKAFAGIDPAAAQYRTGRTVGVAPTLTCPAMATRRDRRRTRPPIPVLAMRQPQHRRPTGLAAVRDALSRDRPSVIAGATSAPQGDLRTCGAGHSHARSIERHGGPLAPIADDRSVYPAVAAGSVLRSHVIGRRWFAVAKEAAPDLRGQKPSGRSFNPKQKRGHPLGFGRYPHRSWPAFRLQLGDELALLLYDDFGFATPLVDVGLATAHADHSRQLFDSQVESFCRRLRNGGGRVCYRHSEGDSTALGRRSRQHPRTGRQRNSIWRRPANDGPHIRRRPPTHR